MRPKQPADGKCPSAGTQTECNLACKYNYFSAGELSIHSWELKCLDCGFRQTIAWRSDEPDETADNPAQCPFCGKCGLNPGRNPCDAA